MDAQSLNEESGKGERPANPEAPPAIGRETKPPPRKHSHPGREWFKDHGVELAGALIVAWYTCVASRQLTETQRANGIATETLKSQQRAVLSAGDIEQIDKGIRIHLINAGHSQARITGGSIKCYRISIPNAIKGKGEGFIDQRSADIPTGGTIAPDSHDFTITISLPVVPTEETVAIDSGSEVMTVDGDVMFDDGFGKNEKLPVIGTLSRGKWTSVSQSVFVSLSTRGRTGPN